MRLGGYCRIRVFRSSRSSEPAASDYWFFTVLMITDYRGFLTNYTHQCWLYYQRSWYQRIFRWSVNRRRLYADEAVLRRHFRVMAIPGIVMGLFFVTVEFAALITGHVA